MAAKPPKLPSTQYDFLDVFQEMAELHQRHGNHRRAAEYRNMYEVAFNSSWAVSVTMLIDGTVVPDKPVVVRKSEKIAPKSVPD